MNDKNHQTYSRPLIVNYYQQLQQLQPAEVTIIKRLEQNLSQMKMLDLGVGGGRTTKYFLPLVKEYIGIDYSTAMIAACRERFMNNKNDDFKLRVGDARDLSEFSDNYFDFILFSFNGIDYISHADRLKVFQEISRIGKSGSYFFFSTHNLQGIEPVFNWKNHLKFNPFKTYIDLVMYAFVRGFNPSLNYQTIKDKPYAIIRDESHNFNLQTYYIRSSEQIKQLQSNFDKIQVYSWQTGLELRTENEMRSCKDMWLYYLCLIK